MRRATAPFRALAGVALLVAAVAAAPVQDTVSCPEKSQSPQCVSDEPAAPAPAEEETRPAPTQRPTTPPGRATEPASEDTASTPAPGRDDDPQPTRGSDQPAPTTAPSTGPGTRPSTGARDITTPPRPSRSPDATTPPGQSIADEETGAPIPPPPPDLGARRVLGSRFVQGATGLELAIEVVEARARGVDGGWTVTVAGGDAPAALVRARPHLPAGPVGLIIGRDLIGSTPGFTVVGQRSTTVYDADYLGVMPLADEVPSVITVTLFQ